MSSGAFVDNFQILGNPDGPLKGLKFAAKDLFDVSTISARGDELRTF